MQIFVVEVLNEKAVPLLRDLENLEVIRLIPQETWAAEEPRQNERTGRLSEQFWGVIPPELATDLHRQLDEMRSEWERDI